VVWEYRHGDLFSYFFPLHGVRRVEPLTWRLGIMAKTKFVGVILLLLLAVLFTQSHPMFSADGVQILSAITGLQLLLASVALSFLGIALLLYTLGQKTISLDDAREIAGPAGLQDDWAITGAIEAGDAAVALRQLALMLEAGAPPEKILGQLGWLVRTKFPMLAPGGVRVAVEALFRTDLDLKRSAGEPRVLLERLVVELCAGRGARATRPSTSPPAAS